MIFLGGKTSCPSTLLTQNCSTLESWEPEIKTAVANLDKDKWLAEHPKRKYHQGLLFHSDVIYVPIQKLQNQILEWHHDSPLAGHLGVAKTYELIKRCFWWESLLKDCWQHVSTCSICAQVKSDSHKPEGLLQPLPNPSEPWLEISMNFITDLPLDQGFNTVLVVVDLLTKISH